MSGEGSTGIDNTAISTGGPVEYWHYYQGQYYNPLLHYHFAALGGTGDAKESSIRGPRGCANDHFFMHAPHTLPERVAARERRFCVAKRIMAERQQQSWERAERRKKQAVAEEARQQEMTRERKTAAKKRRGGIERRRAEKVRTRVAKAEFRQRRREERKGEFAERFSRRLKAEAKGLKIEAAAADKPPVWTMNPTHARWPMVFADRAERTWPVPLLMRWRATAELRHRVGAAHKQALSDASALARSTRKLQAQKQLERKEAAVGTYSRGANSKPSAARVVAIEAAVAAAATAALTWYEKCHEPVRQWAYIVSAYRKTMDLSTVMSVKALAQVDIRQRVATESEYALALKRETEKEELREREEEKRQEKHANRERKKTKEQKEEEEKKRKEVEEEKKRKEAEEEKKQMKEQQALLLPCPLPVYAAGDYVVVAADDDINER
jgi:hypothetical protein